MSVQNIAEITQYIQSQCYFYMVYAGKHLKYSELCWKKTIFFRSWRRTLAGK